MYNKTIVKEGDDKMAEIKSCYSKLLGKMAENRMSQKDLAAALEMSEVSLYYRLRDIRPFTQDDICRIKKMFDLTPDEISEIFFTKHLN